jgi:hypothetical protein
MLYQHTQSLRSIIHIIWDLGMVTIALENIPLLFQKLFTTTNEAASPNAVEMI